VADSSDKPTSQYPKPKSDAQKAADAKRADDLMNKAEKKAPTKDPDSIASGRRALLGSGVLGAAADKLAEYPKKVDDAVDRAERGYKKGGKVRGHGSESKGRTRGRFV
jgi:hypothetical protein